MPAAYAAPHDFSYFPKSVVILCHRTTEVFELLPVLPLALRAL